jgi:ParB family chromosome partitioning protein
MAKRKRLSPALLSADIGPETGSNGPLETHSRPPIAQVAGETAEHAAFAELTRTLTEAREEGRLIQRLPLAEIETGHLVRDRMVFDEAEMAALVASLRARGQQVPIEVVARAGGGYGLISGLRRVMALREIGEAEVLALVRRPETSSEAYLAMVEENEIRAGISFYERARLAAEAAKLGIYPDPRRPSRRCFPRQARPSDPRSGPSCGCMRRLGTRSATPRRSPNGWALRLPRPSTGTGRRPNGWPGARRCDADRQRGGARGAGKGAERGAENRL